MKSNLLWATILTVVLSQTTFSRETRVAENVSSILDNWGESNCVAIDGDFAYVGTELRGLCIVNISDPSHLVEVGHYQTRDEVTDAVVTNDIVYILCRETGLYILNVTNRDNPVLIERIDPLWNNVIRLKKQGDYLFIIDGTNGLYIIDVADPRRPGQAGRFRLAVSCFDLAVAGDFAYIAVGVEGLKIVNIADHGNLTEVSSYETPYAQSVSLKDNYVFIADRYSGLIVLDVSDPTSPHEVAHVDEVCPAHYVTTGLNMVHVLTDTRVRSIDVSDPTSPELRGDFRTRDKSNMVTESGDRLFVADKNGGLAIIDSSDPNDLREIGVFNPGQGTDIKLSGDYAFIACRYGGLKIVNISDIARPVILSQLLLNYPAMKVIIKDNYAFVVLQNRAVAVVDISIVEEPRLLRYAYENPDLRQVELVGEHLFIVLVSGTLVVVNVSNPEDPEVVSQQNLDLPYIFTASEGSRLYFGYRGRIKVVGVTDPESPRLLGDYYRARGYDYDMTSMVVKRGHVYLLESYYADVHGLSFNSNIVNVDCSDPDSIRTAGVYFSDAKLLLGYSRYLLFGSSTELAASRLRDVNPQPPQFFWQETTQSEILGFALSEDGVIVTIEERGIELFDATNLLGFGRNDDDAIPISLSLSAFPNPFNSSTTINYSLPMPGRYAIDVIDIQGRLVTRLSDQWRQAGSYREVWDAGSTVSGVYMLRLQSENESAIRTVYQIR